MGPMPDFWTAQLAFLAFLLIAVFAFGVIMLDFAFMVLLRSRARRKAHARAVTPARRPSGR